MIDGVRIAPHDTAETLGMDDEDHIDVAMEQTGGMHAASTGTLATRCRQCLTGGLDAHALPGTDLCAVHSGGAASTDMIVDAIYTGLTQEMASASI